MKTKTSTKRMARRLAVVLSLAVACASQAGTFDWTGATDSYWKTTSNWNASGSCGSRTLPTNDDMVFKKDNFSSRFTENEVIFDGAYRNDYRTFVRNVGSSSEPLVFRAASATDGMQFSKSKGTFIADADGAVYLRFESGKWSTAGTYNLEIGQASYTGNIVLTDGAVFDVGGNVLLKNGKIVLENGTMNVANSGYYFGMGNNAAATLELATGGTLCAAHISDKGKGGTVLFNGGTFKAAFVNASGMMSDNDRISVKVGTDGGMIDANNLDVLFTRPIAPDGASDGGMAFKGGGSVTLKYASTYTGATTVEVGTTLVLPAAIAGENLAFAIPAGLVDGVYEVVRISGGGAFAADVLDDAALPQDANARFFTSTAKTSIYCLYGEVTGDGKVWIGMAGDGRLSNAENWLDSTPPAAGDILNFSAAKSALSINADLSVAPSTLLFGSEVVTIAQGTLDVATLTNANRLAVASGATLNVAGDLVGYAATNDPKPLLYSNHGTVTVGGKVHFRSNGTSGGNSIVYQYAVADADSKPIAATGLAYNADSWSDYLVANLGSMDNGSGKWVVGAAGLTIPYSRNIDRSGFRVTGSQSATLHSSADWTLAESYRHQGNDLLILDTATVTIDTADWNGGSVGHTVTLKGYVNAKGTAASPLSVTGNGKVVLTAVPANNNTNIVNGVLSVASGTTLEIESGVDVAGTGTVSLAAGATLALPANADRTFTTRDIIPVTLPGEGKATLRIDGEKPLKGGDYVLFGNVPTGYADHLTVTGTALGTRRAALTDDGEHLVLSVPPTGLSVIIR